MSDKKYIIGDPMYERITNITDIIKKKTGNEDLKKFHWDSLYKVLTRDAEKLVSNEDNNEWEENK